MKLSSIKIENYRCFENITVGFEKDVTVFVGINGAGKTAILDAITVALWRVVQENLLGSYGQRTPHSRVKQRATLSDSDVRMPSEFDTSAQRVGAPDAVLLRARYDTSEGSVIWTGRQSYRERSGSRRPKLTSGSEDPDALHHYFKNLWEQTRQDPGANIALPAVAYYRSDRKFIAPRPVTGVPTETFDRRALAFEDCLVAGTSYQAFADWFFMRESLELRRQSSTSSSSPNYDFLIGSSAHVEVLPYRDPVLSRIREAVMSAFAHVQNIAFDAFGDDDRLTLMMQIDGQKFAVEQLSDGYRVAIGLIADFARRLAVANPNSPKPLKEPGIMLIDEVELHLHPAWQQTIIPHLRSAFPNTQIIATTHSPQVLTSIDGRCIRILKDRKLFAAPPSTSGAESKRVLEDVLEVDSRPPKETNAIVRELDDLFTLINADKLEEAKAKIKHLKGMAYGDDPAVIDAELTVENRLWEAGTHS